MPSGAKAPAEAVGADADADAGAAEAEDQRLIESPGQVPFYLPARSPDKPQWCQCCNRPVKDVEPAKIRGGKFLMICIPCIRHFAEAVKCAWGAKEFQYYWDLGVSAVPLKVAPPTRGKLRFMELDKGEVARMRAAGYKLRRAK